MKRALISCENVFQQVAIPPTRTYNLSPAGKPPTAKKPAVAPKPIKVVPNSPQAKAEIEAAIRKAAGKPTGELTKADLEKVTRLFLRNKGITNLTPLQRLTELKELRLTGNPNLTKVEIGKLQKALPKCKITHNATK